MRHNYVPAPHSIYEGVRKLEPGTILTLPWNGEPKIERFWDARQIALAGLADPVRASDAEVIDRLEALLLDAVKRRMVADVPVGAFLSGGVDSSAVVALMKAANAGPVRTYTIGFEQALSASQSRLEGQPVRAPNEALQAMARPLEYVNNEAASLSEFASRAVSAGSAMTPGEMVMLSVRCQEFMFHCQLTSNVANRASDGLQQLFRQQS